MELQWCDVNSDRHNYSYNTNTIYGLGCNNEQTLKQKHKIYSQKHCREKNNIKYSPPPCVFCNSFVLENPTVNTHWVLIIIKQKNSKFVIKRWGEQDLTFNDIQQNSAYSFSILISGKTFVGVSIFRWDFWKLLDFECTHTFLLGQQF